MTLMFASVWILHPLWSGHLCMSHSQWQYASVTISTSALVAMPVSVINILPQSQESLIRHGPIVCLSHTHFYLSHKFPISASVSVPTFCQSRHIVSLDYDTVITISIITTSVMTIMSRVIVSLITPNSENLLHIVQYAWMKGFTKECSTTLEWKSS